VELRWLQHPAAQGHLPLGDQYRGASGRQRDDKIARKKAEALRIELIGDALAKAKLFTRQKATEVAIAITSQGEEVYLTKSRQLNDALKGAFNNINCYFPIEEVIKIVDTRGVIDKLNNHEQTTTEQVPEGSSPAEEQDGQSHQEERPVETGS
jgi:hypothetical protein